MTQTILPLIPMGATKITDLVSVYRTDTDWTYFYSTWPIYKHASENERMFKLIIAQLVDSGAVRAVDIRNTFGVSKSKVDRAVRKYREQGVEGFFVKPSRKRGGTKLTKEVLEKAQKLLNDGDSRKDVANELNIKGGTFCKAINDGRLKETKPEKVSTDKSTRTADDITASEVMGVACTNVMERSLAAAGKLNGMPIRFESSLDVPKGGVLCALPALIANGLFEKSSEVLGKIKGYYSLVHILLFLAYMSLCRIKTIEKVRGYAPGEFGKLIGLDRIPEIKCLRKKMDDLCVDEGAEKWASHLSRFWMNDDPEASGTLYIDGHVHVYHGGLTKLPRRFVSRDRLCLRGVTDYWVNDAIGKPFFFIEKTVDPGMIKVIEDDIIPRLLKDIPNQPTKEELKKNPYQCRFILVFDREGYSPKFFKKVWDKHRIACITYHKHPGEDWPLEWFKKEDITQPNGEIVSMDLAEMGSMIGSGSNLVWVREVRKLTASGHQTSLISTAYDLPHIQLAARMFSRWCQENFFQYMMQHFEIDILMDYGTVELSDTEKVINPAWRELNKARNSIQNKLRYRYARFSEINFNPVVADNSKKYAKWLKIKGDLLEEIQQFDHQLQEIKATIKETSKYIAWQKLKDEDKFQRLVPGRKRLMDTVRMICYRAETAMTGLIRSESISLSDSRRLLQDLFVNEADIIPSEDNSTLTVRVHSASTPAANKAMIRLFDQLNDTETTYPGTDLRLVYKLAGKSKLEKVSSQIPMGQES